MQTDLSSRSSRLLTRLVLILSVCLLIWGSLNFGLRASVNPNFWNHIFDRIGGPMTFRFILQPGMALIAAIPVGISDSKSRWRLFEGNRLREGIEATARIMLLGLSMDLIYQLRVLDNFYPVEALLVAVVLALVPYLVFRVLVEAAMRLWLARRR